MLYIEKADDPLKHSDIYVENNTKPLVNKNAEHLQLPHWEN